MSFVATNDRVYNDAFRTFTFSMLQSVSFTYQLPYDPKKSGCSIEKVNVRNASL
jgi:hypothetical protein